MGFLEEFTQKKDILSIESLLQIPIEFVNKDCNLKSCTKFAMDYTKAYITKFSSKRGADGLNDWQRLAKKDIKTTSATRLGSIVAYYGKKDFFVDQSCTLLLNMLSWSKEDKKLWSDFDQERNKFIYNQGNAFESIVPDFFKKKFPSYSIKNWNTDELGLYLGEYNNKSYNIYCRPDFLLYQVDSNGNITEGIIVEVKSSSCATKRIESYKYQLAVQGLLLQYFYPYINFKYCLLFNDKMIEYSLEEILRYQVDILKYVPMFWEDLRVGNYKKITVHELIKSFNNN